MLDYNCFPSIVDRVIKFAPLSVLLQLRHTSKALKLKAEHYLAQHIVLLHHMHYQDMWGGLQTRTRLKNFPTLWGANCTDSEFEQCSAITNKATIIDFDVENARSLPSWFVKQSMSPQLRMMRMRYLSVTDILEKLKFSVRPDVLIVFDRGQLDRVSNDEDYDEDDFFLDGVDLQSDNLTPVPLPDGFRRICMTVDKYSRGPVPTVTFGDAPDTLKEFVFHFGVDYMWFEACMDCGMLECGDPIPPLQAIVRAVAKALKPVRQFAINNPGIKVILVAQKEILQWFELARRKDAPAGTQFVQITRGQYRAMVGKHRYSLETDFGYSAVDF